MSDLPLNKHISSGFEKSIEGLREAILEMGGMVEQQLQDSLNSLVKGDIELAKKVIKHDKKINRKDVNIDRMCMEILALRQPTASDLRLVLSIVKAITDLERIGDLSQHLARMGKKLADKGYSMRYYAEIEHTGTKAQKMLKASLNAFARMDAEAALAAMEIEKDINRESRALTRQVATYMMEDPREIKKAMKLLNAIKAIERIGDHCENLCEYTVYLVKGEDIRYQDFDEVKNKILDSEMSI
ncbi:MAG: phosphate transport system regulatory protein PhoU [Gammaproteobacteria bacterium]|nr:MAG: phosphate transport system regulatory protein PhoU [Gammaproteobacteria bacterium]